jgi:class 3 adenylate cyclase
MSSMSELRSAARLRVASEEQERGSVSAGGGGWRDVSTARTLSLLFTDVEGSTRLVESRGEGYHDEHVAQHALIRASVEDNGGWVAETRRRRCPGHVRSGT